MVCVQSPTLTSSVPMGGTGLGSGQGPEIRIVWRGGSIIGLQGGTGCGDGAEGGTERSPVSKEHLGGCGAAFLRSRLGEGQVRAGWLENTWQDEMSSSCIFEPPGPAWCLSPSKRVKAGKRGLFEQQ